MLKSMLRRHIGPKMKNQCPAQRLNLNTAVGLVRTAFTAAFCLLLTCASNAGDSGSADQEPSLLFHYSADAGLEADTAFGDKLPVFADYVQVRQGGPYGPYLEADGRQVLAWQAPGNIYTKKGTLALFWRAREPAGEIEFPVFRVGYADHTSWDMTWLRVDWNGKGFDAFITDINLARLRVSHDLGRDLSAKEWVHLAVAWDESTGMTFYVNGELAGGVQESAMLDAGLSFFGPHSRIISAFNVQSMFNFQRGGDVDEIRIYDQKLSPESIRKLANDQADTALVGESMSNDASVWGRRFGWQDGAPPYLASATTTIRRVEFADAIDVKQFMWRGNDGIRETTWPGVYNRSALPGRTDYFILPDWNVYSAGGKKITYTFPDECWNRIEVQGAATGLLTYDPAADADADAVLGRRKEGDERTTHDVATRCGGMLTFENDVQETPIQEIGAYNVAAGSAPEDAFELVYTVQSVSASAYPELDDLVEFINGRYVKRERATVVATPPGTPPRFDRESVPGEKPLFHVLIPYGLTESRLAEPYRRFSASTYTWNQIDAGLDGIVLELPAFEVDATHEDGLYPINIRVKDPIWPARDMLDVNVSVRPGESREVFLDTRDRVLPNDTSLYLSLATAGGGLDSKDLVGMRIRLVFKDRAESVEEHVQDRFMQVRDNWGFIVEPQPVNRRLPALERTYRDIYDLLRVDPSHERGKAYWRDIVRVQPPPKSPLEPVGDGVPRWAVRQTQALSLYRKFAQWWIDNRFVDGEFGGGLSDDSDFMNYWPGLKLMGADPKPLESTHRQLVDAIYRNDMMTDGLPTIMTDDLHTYEEGINANSQAMHMDWSDPIVVERLMSTAKHLSRLSAVNEAGHRHLVSNYYSASRVARESPWEWTGWLSYFNLHPSLLLIEYNDYPGHRELVLELADGILSHGRKQDDGYMQFPNEIHWSTDAERGVMGPTPTVLQVMWAAYRWTGERRYLEPLEYVLRNYGIARLGQISENVLQQNSAPPHWIDRLEKAAGTASADDFVRTQYSLLSGDLSGLADLYEEDIHRSRGRMYVVTDGHMWTDRIELPTENMQRARLGGVALTRFMFYPGHAVSWEFKAPADATDVGIIVTSSSRNMLKVRVYNVSDRTVDGQMIGWNVNAGTWRVNRGVDSDNDGEIDRRPNHTDVQFERGTGIDVSFPPRSGYVIEMEQLSGSAPQIVRPDLGISDRDIRVNDRDVELTVHSLGSVDAPGGVVVLATATGQEVSVAEFPPLPAPRDFKPSTATVSFRIPTGLEAEEIRIRLDVDEISKRNNVVRLH